MDVVVGQDMTKDTVLGISGSSGVSEGAHLHFELRKENNPIDPCQYIDDPPSGCSVNNRCTVGDESSRSYSALVPLPGVRTDNLRETVELIKR